jgi:hypothetical protein
MNGVDQGCQMVYFHTKNPNVGVWSIGIFYGYLVYFMAIKYILWSFGTFWYVVEKKNLATMVWIH